MKYCADLIKNSDNKELEGLTTQEVILGKNNPSPTIFIGNISKEISRLDLKEFIEKCLSSSSFFHSSYSLIFADQDIILDENSDHLGYAFISFNSLEKSIMALKLIELGKMEKNEINGIKVDFSFKWPNE